MPWKVNVWNSGRSQPAERWNLWCILNHNRQGNGKRSISEPKLSWMPITHPISAPMFSQQKLYMISLRLSSAHHCNQSNHTFISRKVLQTRNTSFGKPSVKTYFTRSIKHNYRKRPFWLWKPKMLKNTGVGTMSSATFRQSDTGSYQIQS